MYGAAILPSALITREAYAFGDRSIIWTSTGPLYGVVAGLLPALLIRRYLPDASGWVLAHVLGETAAAILYPPLSDVSRALFRELFQALGFPIDRGARWFFATLLGLAAGVASGSVTGVAQRRILTDYGVRAARWPIVLALSWGAARSLGDLTSVLANVPTPLLWSLYVLAMLVGFGLAPALVLRSLLRRRRTDEVPAELSADADDRPGRLEPDA